MLVIGLVVFTGLIAFQVRSIAASPVSRSVAAMLPAPRNTADSRFRLNRTGRWRVNRRPATLPAQPMTQPRGELRTDSRSPLACRAAASGSTSSPQGFPPAHQPRRTLGTARRNPRLGNPPPRRAPSAGPYAPPRSPGRRLQPAEPPHPHRVTPQKGKQHRIRDDPVVRSPDGSRQILRPSASITIRGRARQVALSGPRGTYQISQPGNCRSSSRRRRRAPRCLPPR